MISTNNNRNDTEAIYFFDDGHIIKEMLYVEFEAVLDAVVGIPECRNKHFNAAYVSIENGLRVQAAVLFNVGFDDDGHVLDSWNLPLRYLASQADMGPDLGDGPVKVVTAADCDDLEYRDQLWDCGKRLVELLTLIKRSVKRNKLAIYSRAQHRASIDSMSAGLLSSLPGNALMPGLPAFFSEFQKFSAPNYMAANLEAALLDQRERVRNELAASHADSIQKLTEQNEALKLESEALVREKQQIEAEARKQIELIVDKYKAKLGAQLVEQDKRWQDKISEKELLLHYAEEKQKQLQEEIVQLRRTIESEKDQAVEDFLQEVAASGMEMIATEKGLGSFAVKPREVFDYLESPAAFLAAQYGIAEAAFKAWRIHYKNPVCQAGSSTGCGCAVPVKPVDDPRNFVMGESDVCHAHRMKKVGEY